jgi:hypothetical protein
MMRASDLDCQWARPRCPLARYRTGICNQPEAQGIAVELPLPVLLLLLLLVILLLLFRFSGAPIRSDGASGQNPAGATCMDARRFLPRHGCRVRKFPLAQ